MLVKAFWTIGGFAGVVKIIEWFVDEPKITGNIEQTICADENNPDGSYAGQALLLQIYLVNARMKPTTIKAFDISALVDGKWIVGRNIQIPDRIPNVPVDFSKVRLYELVGLNLLEYGKGVRGWIRLRFPGLRQDQLRSAPINIKLTDALGKKHTIHDKHQIVSQGLSIYPGGGVSGN